MRSVRHSRSLEPVWDNHNAQALRDRLGVSHLDLYDEIGSTQDIAHDLAERGAEAGTIVLADAQRVGRGRMGRSWTSEPGQGVWCTLVERPVDLKALDVLSLRVGLLLAEQLDAFANDRVRLKWPNDLVVSDGKVAGILVEARWSGGVPAWVAIGIGVNVRAPAVAGAAGLRDDVRRVGVLAVVVGAAREAGRSPGWLTEDELRRYNARDLLQGRRLVSPGIGIARGIAPSGSLLVETPQGIEQHRAGTIEFAEEL
jgi:BirA family transcriptional regulator, biotin operon repressor / biotin---[acetyl-CoA-carboxylase] ligase